MNLEVRLRGSALMTGRSLLNKVVPVEPANIANVDSHVTLSEKLLSSTNSIGALFQLFDW
jgi:hypothetical protein